MSQAPQLTWAQLRSNLNTIAGDKGEWGGIPIPVEHVKLIMEPRYPMRSVTGAKLGKKAEPEPGDDELVHVNEWFDYHKNCNVIIYRDHGKIRHCLEPQGYGQRFTFWMNTLGVAASNVWGVEQEIRALTKLAELITPHAMTCYMLSGCFLETSARSGVRYMFRKLRPTIALKGMANGLVQTLACLCLHPLGFYDQSWAGVMCPTDDVIAHLVLMRGDERKFWGKANHHVTWMASSGI